MSILGGDCYGERNVQWVEIFVIIIKNIEMTEQGIERRHSKRSSNENKSLVGQRKTKAELEQEAYMARQYAIVIGELKAAEARNR